MVSVYVGEQLVMVQNDYGVLCMYIFLPIKPCMVCHIPPWLLNFDQNAINEPNTPWQLLQMCTQGNPLFMCGSFHSQIHGQCMM